MIHEYEKEYVDLSQFFAVENVRSLSGWRAVEQGKRKPLPRLRRWAPSARTTSQVLQGHLYGGLSMRPAARLLRAAQRQYRRPAPLSGRLVRAQVHPDQEHPAAGTAKGAGDRSTPHGRQGGQGAAHGHDYQT